MSSPNSIPEQQRDIRQAIQQGLVPGRGMSTALKRIWFGLSYMPSSGCFIHRINDPRVPYYKTNGYNIFDEDVNHIGMTKTQAEARLFCHNYREEHSQMDNFNRGDNALAALRATGAYEDIEKTLNPILPTPDGDEVEVKDLAGYPISDLMADLLHLAARFGIDPFVKIREAIEHYGADIVEQAFYNDDENFTETLQDEANAPQVRRILEINNVPTEYWAGIETKLGI